MKKYSVLSVFALFAVALASMVLVATSGTAFAMEKGTVKFFNESRITVSDLGITDVGTLPTSRWYFFKEWGRGIERFFTFNAVKKTELELRITNEKAAEALAVQTAKPDDAKALKSALENYTEGQKRLGSRIAKLKENSENPNVEKLLERLDEQTLKHANLLNQLAQRWNTDPYAEDTMRSKTIGDPDFDLIANAIKDAQGKIQGTVAAATEKDKNIEQKAKDQIQRAEEAIGELELTVAGFAINEQGVGKTTGITVDEYGVEPAGIAIDEGGVPKPKTGINKGTQDLDNQAAGIAIGDPGVNGSRISTNLTIERQTPKRDFGDRMKAGLETAGGMLANAKTAFAEKKFGEAFGQARAAEVTAWNGLRTIRKTGSQGDYFPAHTFTLEIDGVIQGRFKEITGLESETEIIEIKDGDDMTIRKRPGRTKYSNIVLKRGFINDPALWDWHQKVIKGVTQRKSGSVIMLDKADQEVKRYNFFGAWPCKWKGWDLDGKGDDTRMVEEIEFCVERVEIGSAPNSKQVSDRAYEKKLEDIRACGPQPGAPGNWVCKDGKWQSLEAIFIPPSGDRSVPSAPASPTAPNPTETTKPNERGACTQEAKLCPDGSAVGRTGPNCEFAVCPGVLTKPTEGMVCTQEYNPVCGADGKTYGNACMANISGVAVKYGGECASPKSDASIAPETAGSVSR